MLRVQFPLTPGGREATGSRDVGDPARTQPMAEHLLARLRAAGLDARIETDEAEHRGAPVACFRLHLNDPRLALVAALQADEVWVFLITDLENVDAGGLREVLERFVSTVETTTGSRRVQADIVEKVHQGALDYERRRSEADDVAAGGSTAVPGQGSTVPEVNALYRRIVRALVKRAPEGWQQLRVRYQEAGPAREAEASALDATGSRIPLPDPDPDLLEAFSTLREVFAQPGKGAWYTAVLSVDPEFHLDMDFDYDDEPSWRQPVNALVYYLDQQRYPRTPEVQPQWLQHRLASLDG